MAEQSEMLYKRINEGEADGRKRRGRPRRKWREGLERYINKWEYESKAEERQTKSEVEGWIGEVYKQVGI